MGMSAFYVKDPVAIEDESLACLDKAVELGVNLLNTATFYGNGHNETLIGRAIKKHGRDKFVITSKCGVNWSL